MLKELDQDNPVTPAEKPTFRKSRPSRKPTRCCDMCTCKCPAVTTSPMKPMQKPAPPAVNLIKAPTLETKPKICPRLMRHNKATIAAAADTTTDNSAYPTARHCNNAVGPPTTTTTANGSGVELVPLLARRRAFNRPISLSTTDITKRTASNDRYASKMPQKCHHGNSCLNKSCINHKIDSHIATCCLKKFTLHIR